MQKERVDKSVRLPNTLTKHTFYYTMYSKISAAQKDTLCYILADTIACNKVAIKSFPLW